MAPFIFAVVLVSILIFGGVVVNLYLYSRGAVGTQRFNRTPRLRPATAGSVAQEAIAEDQFYMQFGETGDDEAHYARSGMVVILAFVLMVSFVLISIVNAALH